MALYLLARIVFTEEAENHSGLYKDGFMSESTGRFSNFPKNVGAENYPELLHPVHGNDKIDWLIDWFESYIASWKLP